MNVDVTVSPKPRLPRVAGAHELAWSYLLDEIFSDAYHARLEGLRIVLPSTALEAKVHLRSECTPQPSGATGTGVALLAGSDLPVTDARRIYCLEFGLLASPSLPWSLQEHKWEWALQRQRSVYTWKALAWGIPIRFATMMERPYLVDRCMFAMRRVFVRSGTVPAYYRLSIWSRA